MTNKTDNPKGGIWDQIEGGWKQIKGRARETWGSLTDDDLEYIKGKRDVLAGKIQERYGIAKEEANRQIDDWANKLKV
jgi:uncharacterized protein YjbJ (UPF0337 family)